MRTGRSLRRIAVLVGLAVCSAVVVPSPAAARGGYGAGTGSVFAEELSGGNGLLVYVPDGVEVGRYAASTPILMVFGDEPFDEASAAAVARSSGLARIAADELGVVAFLNPAGDDWAASDADVVIEALGRFGSSTGGDYDTDGQSCAPSFPSGEIVCRYPGSEARTYLFAEGSGADFVSEHVVAGLEWTHPFPAYPGQVLSWTPSAVFIENGTVPAVDPGVPTDVPAFVVDSSRAVEASYRALNEDLDLFGKAHDGRRGTFRWFTVRRAYHRVLSQAIARRSEVVDWTQVFEMPDPFALRLSVRRRTAEVSSGPIEYIRYVPWSSAFGNRHRSDRHGSLPLVVAFHGGGDDATSLVSRTEWAQLASEEDFMLVAVERHADRSATDIAELVEQLLADNPVLDASRVYATGFSMGSVKTFALSEEYPTMFAAFAPMSGSFGNGTAVSDAIVPTIYFAGISSPLPERPHQNGTPNNIDLRLADMLTRTGVTDSYVYDGAANANWGIAADQTTTVTDGRFGTSVEIGAYASADGNTYLALAAVTGASHETLPVEGRIAWDFLSQFSRAADGSVIIEGGTFSLDALD